ncbi:MAG: dTDP-glucose 4,6-dehydratase, partial [Deinococcota bacterium]
ILITGVAGFIGSNYAHFVAKQHPDYQLIGLDKLTPYSCRDNIRDLEASGRLMFHQVDIADQQALAELYQKYDINYVVNFAAESHNDRAINNPTSFVHSNVVGAQTMLEVSRLHGVKRHVHVSTIEVYGEQGEHVPYFDESSPLNAKTPYSASKAAGDIIVRSYMQTYLDMDIAITHCANNYGPFQFPEKLIPLAITNILRGKKALLYGDGLQKRDWLHVEDHCRGIDLVVHRVASSIDENAATNPGLLPIYDFSARHELTNIEILQKICKVLGKEFEACVQFVADRPNHDRRYLINPEKAERELGFRPEVEFDAGMEATVAWYIDNKQWWENIIDTTGELAIDWATPSLSK